jgi:2-hydroxy-3-keto-5-methylthiopentenyl-1-phosphate phosphatase
VSSGRLKCRVLVDFDGTIATVDTTDLLLERFAEPGWLAIEDEWKAGRIGSRECMIRQIDLVKATPDQYDDFVSSIEIDPGFSDFVAACEKRDVDVLVVSDGLDRTVGTVLKRAGFDLPFRANQLRTVGADRWRLTFPHARGDCQVLSGNCKCQFADAARGSVRVVVGDGRSDFCVSGRADLVLAKGALADHCRNSNLPHFAFTRFEEATDAFGRWLDDRDGRSEDGRMIFTEQPRDE